MNQHRPGMPQLSLAAIARSIFEPHRPALKEQPVEADALQMLQRASPVLMNALRTAYQRGLLNADQLRDIRKSFNEVMTAFGDLAQRQKKLGEAYDIRRESDAALKVKATASLDDFCQHLDDISELARRLRGSGNLENAEYLALLDLQELLRRCSREIIVWAN